MTDDSTKIWAAVDRLTNPTTQKVMRDGTADAEWLAEVKDGIDGVCDVPAYRAGSRGHAVIPSLWDQSTLALEGGEVSAGRGSKPLRERSIADLDLMEIRSIVRDTIRHHLEEWGDRRHIRSNGDYQPFSGADIRAFASLAITRLTRPEWCRLCRCHHLADFWEYRFASWARLIETYLRAAEHQIRPVYLRNSQCPTCRTGQVRVDRDGDAVVVPALVIDFRDGYVRAAECQACGDSWWRGPDLEWLAAELGVRRLTEPGGMMTA